ISSRSSGNYYMIDDRCTTLLREAGVTINEIRKDTEFKLNTIAGVLLSHEHQDHSKAVKDVLKAGIDTYASAGTVEAMNLSHHRLKTVETMKRFTIGTWNITAFDVQHDAAEPIGFVLENEAGDRILFATDTYYVKYKFSGLTHVMLECNYSKEILDRNIESGRVHPAMKKRLIQSHFSLENVKEFLKANDLSKVEEIHLLHLSDTNSDEKLFKEEIQKLTGKVVYIA